MNTFDMSPANNFYSFASDDFKLVFVEHFDDVSGFELIIEDGNRHVYVKAGPYYPVSKDDLNIWLSGSYQVLKNHIDADPRFKYQSDALDSNIIILDGNLILTYRDGMRDGYPRTDLNLEQISDFPFIMWAYFKGAFIDGVSPRVEIQTSRTGLPRLDEEFITLSIEETPTVLFGDLSDIPHEE